MSTGGGCKTYQDFVLKIVRAGEGSYCAEAQALTGEARASFEAPFDHKDLELLLLKVGHPRRSPTLSEHGPAEMQPAVEFGGRLYNAVMRGEVRDLLIRARYENDKSWER